MTWADPALMFASCATLGVAGWMDLRRSGVETIVEEGAAVTLPVGEIKDGRIWVPMILLFGATYGTLPDWTARGILAAGWFVLAVVVGAARPDSIGGSDIFAYATVLLGFAHLEAAVIVTGAILGTRVMKFIRKRRNPDAPGLDRFPFVGLLALSLPLAFVYRFAAARYGLPF